MAALRAGTAPRRLPPDAAFDLAHGGGDPVSYESGWLACRMVADRFGEQTLVRFYRRVQAVGLGRGLREVLHLEPADFTAQWRDYLHRTLAIG